MLRDFVLPSAHHPSLGSALVARQGQINVRENSDVEETCKEHCWRQWLFPEKTVVLNVCIDAD